MLKNDISSPATRALERQPPMLALPLHDSQEQDTHSMSQQPLCTPVDQVIARTEPPSQQPPSPIRTVVKRRRIHSRVKLQNHFSFNNSKTTPSPKTIPNNNTKASTTSNSVSNSNNTKSLSRSERHHQQPPRPPSGSCSGGGSNAPSFLVRADSLDGQSVDNLLAPTSTTDDDSLLLNQASSLSQQCSQRDLPQFSQDTLALLPNIVREHQLERYAHQQPPHQLNQMNQSTRQQNSSHSIKEVRSSEQKQHQQSRKRQQHDHYDHEQSQSNQQQKEAKTKSDNPCSRIHKRRASTSSDGLLRASLVSALTAAPPMLNPYLPPSAPPNSASSSRRVSNASESYQNLDGVLQPGIDTSNLSGTIPSIPGQTTTTANASIATNSRFSSKTNHPNFGPRANSQRRKSLKLLLVSSSQQRQDKSAQFDMRDMAGRGAFSEVWRAVHRIDGCEYAIKKNRVALLSDNARLQSLHEVFALAALQGHPNILRYFDAWFEDHGKFLYLQTEFLPRGNIHERYVEKGISMPTPLLLALAHDVSAALEYMHSMDIAHIDVKPDNIFCGPNRTTSGTTSTIMPEGDSNDRPTFIIGDFGLACHRYGFDARNTEGDSRYLCPEALSSEDEICSPIPGTGIASDPVTGNTTPAPTHSEGSSGTNHSGTEEEGKTTKDEIGKRNSGSSFDGEQLLEKSKGGDTSSTTRSRRLSISGSHKRDLCVGDVFSLGATLYEVATGSPLDKSGPQWKHLRTHPEEAASVVARRTQSSFLAEIVRKCLEPNPAHRASAADIRKMCAAHGVTAERDSLRAQLAESKARVARFERVMSSLLQKGEEGRQRYRNSRKLPSACTRHHTVERIVNKRS